MQFFSFFNMYAKVIFVILFLIYMVACIKKKEDSSHLLLPFWISLLMLLVASHFGFYPLETRLIQVYQLVVLILAGYGCHTIMEDFSKENENSNRWIVMFYYGALACCLAITAMSGLQNLSPQQVYKPSSEVRESMAYLNQNLTDEDVVYVFFDAIPVYQYETGKVRYHRYSDMPSHPVVFDDNVIYGKSLINYTNDNPFGFDYVGDRESIEENAEVILQNDSVYIFASAGENGLERVLELLAEHGRVETVVDYYNTHLYYFARD